MMTIKQLSQPPDAIVRDSRRRSWVLVFPSSVFASEPVETDRRPARSCGPHAADNAGCDAARSEWQATVIGAVLAVTWLVGIAVVLLWLTHAALQLVRS
jgi:hypothetical protein